MQRAAMQKDRKQKAGGRAAGAALGLACALACGLVPMAAAWAEPVVIARKTVYPGQQFSRDMLEIYETDGKVISPEAYASEMSEVLGQVARRTVLPNRLIHLSALRAPDLVKAGSEVSVLYRDGGLSIGMLALALGDGGQGDPVTLRNTQTGHQFAGIVQADGSVLVQGQ